MDRQTNKVSHRVLSVMLYIVNITCFKTKALSILLKVKSGAWQSSSMFWAIRNSAHRAGTLFQFRFGSLESANSVRNIKTADSLQKNIKQFASWRKESQLLGPGMDYSSILIHLLSMYIFIQMLKFMPLFLALCSLFRSLKTSSVHQQRTD